MRIVLMVATLGLAACQPNNGDRFPPPSDIGFGAQVEIAAMLNRERAQAGRAALTWNAELTAASQAHAQDMFSNDYFSHTGRNGSSFSDRARAAGYGCAAAENIAFGQQSEADVMSAWMNSAGHRRNILLGDAREFGIGRVGDIWVLMMGRGC
ncbi:MAG: CAP domain-containing protein [Octadecabacter sp.]